MAEEILKQRCEKINTEKIGGQFGSCVVISANLWLINWLICCVIC